MMIKNKLLTTIFTFIFISTSAVTAYAEEEPDYEQINQGDCVKTDGFFFSQSGMVKLATNVEEKTKLAILDKQKELNLCNVDLQKCISGKKIELQIQKDMYEEQLIIKQKVIDAQKSEAFWKNIQAGLSGLVVGTVLGVGIFYFVSSK